MFSLKYCIADIEVLKNYFSLQIKNEKGVYKNLKCRTDKDIYYLSKLLQKSTRPYYFYSIDFDKIILNAMVKMVDKKEKNIISKLVKLTRYLIDKKVPYSLINREFWGTHYFPKRKKFKNLTHKEIFDESIREIQTKYNNENITDFLNEFGYTLGEHKTIKQMNILSIPKILYYYNIDKNGLLKMNISLKKLQLIEEGYNIKFDFNKYTDYKDIEKDGLVELFDEYSKNDVEFLERLFLKTPKKDIMKRVYAFNAINRFTKVEYDERLIYAENNTRFIDSIFNINNPKKHIDIDYTEFINTPYEKFNSFVKFCNENKNIKSDKELKDEYCKHFETEYIDDDYNITTDNKVETVINSFDEIVIGDKYNLKFGLGGIHGAIEKYIFNGDLDKDFELLHLDYTSQYPSIVILFKMFFQDIMNVDLYEMVYNGRVGEKAKKENDRDYEIIDGFKLLLNMSYGIINSNFNLGISNKTLGRFICLFGQSLLINLAHDLCEVGCELVNDNTDGIICKKPIDLDISEVIKKNEKNYLSLGITKIQKLYQLNVNNYLKIYPNGKFGVKGMFNVKIKNLIARHERLGVNVQNAINLLTNKPVEIKPIYFNTAWVNKKETSYYFTDKNNGEQAIKTLKNPEIMTLNQEIMYFTTDKEKAKLSLYERYAGMTKDKIMDFTFIDSNKSKKDKTFYYEMELIKEDDEVVKSKRKQIREVALKLSPDDKPKNGNCYIGYCGYNGDMKQNSFSVISGIIKPLANYTKSDILKSTSSQGISIENYKDDLLIIDIDIYNHKTGRAKKEYYENKVYIDSFIDDLKKCKTFSCWNSKTKRYNRKYIFRCENSHLMTLKAPYSLVIETVNKATIKSFYDTAVTYECNDEKVKDFDFIDMSDYFYKKH